MDGTTWGFIGVAFGILAQICVVVYRAGRTDQKLDDFLEKLCPACKASFESRLQRLEKHEDDHTQV